MRELTLDLDALCVESFHTGTGAGRGTVRGNQANALGVTRESDPWTGAGDPLSCGGSCDPTCEGTCDRSCNGTCAGGSRDTCLYVTCGGCTRQPPEHCW
ncbi:MAG TPA: hypothetical protein VF142_00680 [Longimicrobium sp.]